MTRVTPHILRFEELTSTNEKAKEMVNEGQGEGTVIVAEWQTRGRGRGSHLWHSPRGGLYLSTLFYPREPTRATDLSILAGVAMAQAVTQLLPKGCEITVKWPNDCLIGWKKVGGVLCESLGDELLNLCVVGIGMNVNIEEQALEPFKNNLFSATSFSLENGGGRADLENVLNTIVAKLFTLYHLYHDEGFSPLQYLWEKNCKFIGRKVEFRDYGKPEPIVGTLLGIDENGALVLSNQNGDRERYVSGEITCFSQ